ncbi:MAG: carboxymuconolactone decarboxylase family protein [Bacteroidetes bacterium]|nr:carboxymuconolactone decarboxylase family protein [Bacteroidota bacterium]
MAKSDFEDGLKIRREVMGDFYVDRALGNMSDFNRDLQDLVTRYCWNDVWGRPGLPRKTRSLLNIVMLTALNRSHELEAHVMGAINNGCTPEEISEALLQATVYCGFPAGIDGFRTAKAILEKNGVLSPASKDT